ncbi:alpha/beta hydrolase [Sphingomonas sp. Leaf343]|uniref:alpha/beta hydrolase n=1 Tax=Sphingomonas sp. Leaf343 TaxID=1736345 RepID=UPI0006FFFBBE|nr:alpha/beta hydrolase [Sphingomonas sp. Leaf343]KQR87645.1 alpha/beta hydrolase [Sphingomonas sp. Leaf343]
MRIGRTPWVGAILGGLAAACAPVRIFDAMMPKDGGVAMVARNVAYGGEPRQRLDVYAPRRTGAATPLPVVIFFYGGSWNSGTKAGYGFVGRALAARGFVVVVPDYRLVPDVRYPTFLRDNAAAVRWVRAHVAALGGDPDRLVLAGHSAGAYNATMLAIDPRWLGRDRAAVRGWIGLAGPYDFLPLDGDVTRATFGDTPDLPATQPGAHVAEGDPPALLVTGDDDTLVRPSNSDTLARQLTAAGVPVERVRYPGIGHAGVLTAIARPFRRRAPVLADMATFATRVTASGR